MVRGKVWLVGAGPGDPELLTRKAERVLKSARVVLYDHLVGDGVIELLPSAARRIYVGKQEGLHTLPQEQINELLVRTASEGEDVVRLKGGDPYIFGRGGEEALALARAGIAFEVIPGITSAQGMAACTGMPLTHRECASTLVLATGHGKEGEPDMDWAALARPRQTVVIYMGVRSLERICTELAAHGLPASTPAAIVERATTPQQRVLRAELAALPALATAQQVRPPALIVIGNVVALNDELGPR